MAQQLIPSRRPSKAEIISEIINLPEWEFWKLVSVRLNIPLFTNQIEEGKIPDAKDRQYWIEDFLIEEVFLRLAGTKILVKHDGKGVSVHKYYSQALRLRKWIPIAKPVPEFIVNMSDLTTRIISELKTADDSQYVLKQAAGRIFENIDPRQYHLSIARNLEVTLRP
jgi:hypothetical protein